MGLVHAPLPYTFKACPLLMCLPWPRGSSVHSAAYSWLLMVWIVFWFFIGLLLSRVVSNLIVGFPLLSPLFAPYVILLPFLSCHCYFCCGIIWPMLVGPFLGLVHVLLSIGYNDPVWSLDLYLCYFGLSWPIILLVGSFSFMSLLYFSYITLHILRHLSFSTKKKYIYIY